MSTAPERYPGPAPTSTSIPTTTASSALKFDSSKIPLMNRATTLWLIVIGVLFLSLIVLLAWLLLRYTCTRASRQRGRQILDQRQAYQQRRIPRPVGDIEAQVQQQESHQCGNLKEARVSEEKETSERPRSAWWPLPPWGLASPGKAIVRGESGPSVCKEGVRRQGVVFV